MKRLIIIAIIAVVVLILGQGFFYTIPEYQQVVKVQLGDPVGDPITEAGLHVKLPAPIQEIYYFDRRLLEWDGDPEVIPTKDSKFIFVDAFARWRISDALTFYKKVVNEEGAQGRLDDILDGLVRDTLSAHTLLEVVRTSDRTMDLGEEALTEAEQSTGDASSSGGDAVHGMREDLTREIAEAAKTRLQELELGIDLVDLQIKRLDYTDKVLRKVYDRMISQQLRIAEKYRALGQGKKAEIAGQLTEESKQIQSEAYRTAQTTVGEGEGESTRIYAEAYGQDVAFYKLVETLRTYEETMNDQGVMILSTDSELYRYLNNLK